MQEPSLNHNRRRFGCRCGTFKPSRRQRRSLSVVEPLGAKNLIIGGKSMDGRIARNLAYETEGPDCDRSLKSQKASSRTEPRNWAMPWRRRSQLIVCGEENGCGQ